MSASAVDNSEIIASSPEIHDPAGERQPRVPSPTLVPSAQPSSQDHIVSRLAAAAAKKTNSKDPADRVRKPSIGLEDAQDQPKAPDADLGDRSQDALNLLQELARKSSDGRTLTAAVQPEKALPSLPAIAAASVESRPAVRNAEPQPPARIDTRRPKARFAIVSVILMAGVAGVFLWSRIPAPDNAQRSEPSASPTVQARSDAPSVQPAAGECDLAAAKDPFATYFLTIPNAVGGNTRQTADGWYSLMSLKARLERGGSGC